MHRQSLGSPNSKLHTHGILLASKENVDLITNDHKRKDQLPSPLAGGSDDDEVRKSVKLHKSPEKLIHLIPMLIIFCFLILFLSSHDPSRKEISSEIDDFGGLLEIEKSDVLAIRSLRNLQGVYNGSHKKRLHRKIIGDF